MNGNLLQDTIDVLGKLEFYSDGGVRRYPYEKEVDAIVARLQNALSDLEPADVGRFIRAQPVRVRL